MEEIIVIVKDSFTNYGQYLWSELTQLRWNNYFYWLLALSFLAWGLEIVFPWRKQQGIVRKDFWLDGFYLFFNFFLFSLIGYNAISNVVVHFFNEGLAGVGITNLVAFEVQNWPTWTHWLTIFLVADFVQWNTHRLLHRVPFLWKFHKVHHSVKEMGFAAHLRFHWMETIVYKTIQYIPLALLGYGLGDFFVVHIFTVLVGHLNHANVGWDYGPLRYIFNNPKMHIWHHAKAMAPNHKYGVNFGLSLSIWDYLFGTAYVPHDGAEIELGFEGDEHYPDTLFGQWADPFRK